MSKYYCLCSRYVLLQLGRREPLGAGQGDLEQRPGDSEDRSSDRAHHCPQLAAPPGGEGHPQLSDLEPGRSHGQAGESLQDLPGGSQ